MIRKLSIIKATPILHTYSVLCALITLGTIEQRTHTKLNERTDADWSSSVHVSGKLPATVKVATSSQQR